MSQVLTRVLSVHKALRTSATVQLVRTAIWSSAADMSWAWAPPMSPTTLARSFFGVRRARWWRCSLKAWTCAQLSSAATSCVVFTSSVEELAATRHELVATRPRADQLDRCADELADSLDVVAAALRQVVPALRGPDLGLPAWHLLVDRGAVLVVRDVGDRVVVARSAKLVAGTDLEQGLVVENVEPHQRRDPDSVEAHGVSCDGRVKPTDAAGPAGHGAELVAALADLVPHLVQQLGWEWSIAAARRVPIER